MVVNDAISDLLARLKNGYMSGATQITLPGSRVKEAVLEVVKQGGYIADYATAEGVTTVTLKYSGKRPALTDVRRISKPGVRIYSAARDLRSVTAGMGLGIVSTPKGIMSHKQAQKLNVGGEVLCKIW